MVLGLSYFLWFYWYYYIAFISVGVESSERYEVSAGFLKGIIQRQLTLLNENVINVITWFLMALGVNFLCPDGNGLLLFLCISFNERVTVFSKEKSTIVEWQLLIYLFVYCLIFGVESYRGLASGRRHFSEPIIVICLFLYWSNGCKRTIRLSSVYFKIWHKTLHKCPTVEFDSTKTWLFRLLWFLVAIVDRVAIISPCRNRARWLVLYQY